MSFTNEDILTLARAGFNASQISALNKINNTPVQAPPAQVQTPVQVQTPPTYNANDTLEKILSAIQTNAINQTQQPPVQTTDDILAEIINPPTREE